MLTILTYLWQDPEFTEKHGVQYSYRDVLLLRAMLDRHLSVPHDYLCVTDAPAQFVGTGIRTAPFTNCPHVNGKIYEKLYTFSPDLQEHGDRFLQVDLDVVVTGNCDPLVQRDEDIVAWRNPRRYFWMRDWHPTIAYYNASLLLIRAGAGRKVWDDFDQRLLAPQWGGDQDWYSHVLGPDLPYWDHDDGVYRLWTSQKNQFVGINRDLPKNARLVFFPGGSKAWAPEVVAANPWIAEHRH